MTKLQVPTDVPIALFPVRLETRFIANSGGNRELLVRVYPDEITTTTHEEPLTAAEISDAEYFWDTYNGGNSQETVESTWDQLVGAYGLPRATHIVRQLHPSSSTQPTTKPADWTKPPRARLLPSRWRAIGFQGGQEVFNVVSNPLSVDELPIGPAPDHEDFAVHPPGDITDPASGAHWLVSFQEAVNVGMAMRIPESASWDYDQGLDKLVVVGVREESQTTVTRDALSAHLSDRFFEDSFGFVNVGTPTNHTEGVKADDAPEARLQYFKTATRTNLSFQGDPTTQTNAERVRRALGMEGVASHPIAFARGADARESDEVSIIHQILWPGTWGYFLEHVLQLSREASGFDSKGNWISRGTGNLEEFYWRYLRPDGPLPTLRVGDQPYGILPTTSLNRWKAFAKTTPDGVMPIGPSEQTLNVARQLRDNMFGPQTSSVPKLGEGTHPHQDFIKVLQQAPRATQLKLRGIVTQTAYAELARSLRWPGQSIGDAETLEANLESLLDDEYGLFGKHSDDAELDFRPEADYSADPGINEPRLARLMPLCVSRRDFDPVVVQVEEDQLNGNSFRFPDYLTWLADASYADIIDDAAGWMSTAQSGEPLPLLALLARHSSIQVLYSTVLAFLTRWGVKDASGVPVELAAFEPDIYDLPSWEPDSQTYGEPELASESIWDWLDKPLAEVVHDTEYEVKSEMTLLDYFEQLRLDPVAIAEDSALKELFSYDIAQPFIRFWLNLFLFSDGMNRQNLEDWAFGQQVHDTIVQIDGNEYLSPLSIPEAYDPSSMTVGNAERYVRSALSASSDRLDAWVTALATQRLDHLEGTGIGYGGFGYVENLTPNTSPPSAGYVHAPSIEQAHTAAVLKSAHLTYEAEEGSSDNAAAIDLSSARVRQAKELIAGVRQGQTLGALLGYRLERGLRERSEAGLNLRKLIQPLREAYPLRVTRLTSTNPDTPASRQVVDGLKVLRANSISLQAMGATTDEETAALAEIDRMRDLVDAAEDLLLAEAVHQIVQGNPNRALASLNAQNRAGVPPDQFDIVDTPRSGRSVTHRVITLLDASGTAAPGASARSKAAPRLNTWLAGVLGLQNGVQSQVSCQISYTTVDATVVSYHITLDELLSSSDFNIEAIDLLYMLPSSEGGQQDVLDAYVRFIVAQKTGVSWPSRDVADPVAIDYTNAQSGHRTFQAFFDAAATIKSVVSSARPLTGQDFAHPSQVVSPALDKNEISARVYTAVTALDTDTGLGSALDSTLSIQNPATTLQPHVELLGVSADTDLTQYDSFTKLPQSADIGALAEELALPDASGLETLRVLLFEASEYGITVAAPLSASSDEPEDRPRLVKQAYAAFKEIERRVEAASKGTPSSASDELDRAKHLFGEDFQPLPLIDGGTANYSHDEVYKTLKASDALLGDNNQAAFGWLGQVSRVRPRVGELQDAMTLSDLLISESTLSSAHGFKPLKVGQLPYDETQNPSWVATSAPPEGAGNALSYLVIDTDGAVDELDPQASSAQRLTGLVIDEWNEVIPADEETTGVTFHYDRPTTRPPQSVILAVAPEVGGGSPEWTDDVLVDVIQETIEMAKIRGVDSAVIADMASGQPGEMLQFLPALLFPDYGNANPPSVFVDFSSYL